jgi:hypothetical protein
MPADMSLRPRTPGGLHHHHAFLPPLRGRRPVTVATSNQA